MFHNNPAITFIVMYHSLNNKVTTILQWYGEVFRYWNMICSGILKALLNQCAIKINPFYLVICNRTYKLERQIVCERSEWCNASLLHYNLRLSCAVNTSANETIVGMLCHVPGAGLIAGCWPAVHRAFFVSSHTPNTDLRLHAPWFFQRWRCY